MYASANIIAGNGAVYEGSTRVYSPNNPQPIPDKVVASLGSSGWSRNVDTGMITQWGSITSGSADAENRGFPMAFPNACFNIVGSAGVPASGMAAADFAVVNRSSFVSKMNGAGLGAYWIATGY